MVLQHPKAPPPPPPCSASAGAQGGTLLPLGSDSAGAALMGMPPPQHQALPHLGGSGVQLHSAMAVLHLQQHQQQQQQHEGQVLQLRAGQVLSPQPNPPCNTLFIGNMSDEVSQEELRSLFATQPGFRCAAAGGGGGGERCCGLHLCLTPGRPSIRPGAGRQLAAAAPAPRTCGTCLSVAHWCARSRSGLGDAVRQAGRHYGSRVSLCLSLACVRSACVLWGGCRAGSCASSPRPRAAQRLWSSQTWPVPCRPTSCCRGAC